jgi:predicted O-methyltransferase YrrM
MKTITIKQYFDSISHDYEKDRESLKDILRLTKTRVKEGMSRFAFVRGMEQTFLMKAIAKNLNASNFFEIGTGRGTSSYAISLLPNIKKVVTVDIVPHQQKKYEAINFKPALVSNEDLFEFITFAEKEKIQFKHISDYDDILKKSENSFDLCFIDGNHSDYDVIKSDFDVCHKLIKNGGMIVWDDYVPDKFTVTNVVDDIIREHSFESTLVECAGHLFKNEGSPEKNRGIVLMKIQK